MQNHYNPLKHIGISKFLVLIVIFSFLGSCSISSKGYQNITIVNSGSRINVNDNAEKWQINPHQIALYDGYVHINDNVENFYIKTFGNYKDFYNKIDKKEVRILEKIIREKFNTKVNLKNGFIFSSTSASTADALPVFKFAVFIDSTIINDSIFQKGIAYHRENPYYYYYTSDNGKTLYFFYWFDKHNREKLKNRHTWLEANGNSISSTILFSSSYLEKKNNPFGEIFKAFKIDESLNYIEVLKWIEKNTPFYTLNKNDQSYWAFFQAAATYSSFVKNSNVFEKEIAEYTHSTKEYYSNEQHINLTYSNIPFSDTIKEIAKNNDILIFNENHWMPKHRLLVSSLLSDLFELGYRNLAVEAINFDADSIQQRGYVSCKDGFYTNEPEMANLLNEAMSMGYRLIKYESINSGVEREIGQAENLKNQMNDDKTIILCGLGHINLSPIAQTMAYFLKESIDKKIFTINQSLFAWFADDIADNSIQIIANNDSTFLSSMQRSQNDMYIVNNLDTKKREQATYAPISVFETRIPERYFNPYYFLFIYRNKDYQKIEKDCVPFSIYHLNDEDFEISIPKNTDLLFQIRDWSNTVVFEKNVILDK